MTEVKKASKWSLTLDKPDLGRWIEVWNRCSPPKLQRRKSKRLEPLRPAGGLLPEFYRRCLDDEIEIATPPVSTTERSALEKNFIRWSAETLRLTEPDRLPVRKMSPKTRELYDEIVGRTPIRETLHSEIFGNRFVPGDILEEYQRSRVIYTEYRRPGLELHLYATENSRVDPERINRLVEYVGQLRPERKRAHLRLVFYTGQQKKMLGKSKFLTPIEINSASTYTGESITIWREHEWPKVLIHELVHFYGDDLPHSHTARLSERGVIGRRFGVSDYDHPNEAVTDGLALLMQLATFDGDHTELLDYEVSHAMIQAAKLLRHLGHRQLSDLTKLETTTSAFSYYILKAAWLLTPNRLIELHRSRKFGSFIEESHRLLDQPEFTRGLERLIPHLPSTDRYAGRQFRMSVFEN